MSRLPLMRNRRCSACGHEFARWLGFIALRFETARPLANAWFFLCLAAGATAFGLGVAWLMAWQKSRY